MKLFKELHSLVWTLVGTGLCLITLSGQTRRWGLWITVLGLTIHLVGLLLSDKDKFSD